MHLTKATLMQKRLIETQYSMYCTGPALLLLLSDAHATTERERERKEELHVWKWYVWNKKYQR